MQHRFALLLLAASLSTPGGQAEAQQTDPQECETDVCRLEQRLEALLPRVGSLTRALKEARTDAKTSEKEYGDAKREAEVTEVLRSAIAAFFDLATAQLATGPCDEAGIEWIGPAALSVSVKSQAAAAALNNLNDLASRFDGLEIAVRTEPVEGCEIGLAPGLRIELTDLGPKRARRSVLDSDVDVPRLPDSGRCGEIGALIDGQGDAVGTGDDLEFWVAQSGGSVVLCKKSTATGNWSVRQLAPDTDALVVVED